MFSIERLQDGKQYKVSNGTAYHIATPDKVVEVLERCRANKTRVTFDFGNRITRESWNEVYGISGYLGRTTGPIKAPILVFSKRSFGGGCILTDCILTIKESRGKKVLYSIHTESVKEIGKGGWIVLVVCPECHGDNAQCWKCDGSGLVKSNRQLKKEFNRRRQEEYARDLAEPKVTITLSIAMFRRQLDNASEMGLIQTSFVENALRKLVKEIGGESNV